MTAPYSKANSTWLPHHTVYSIVDGRRLNLRNFYRAYKKKLSFTTTLLRVLIRICAWGPCIQACTRTIQNRTRTMAITYMQYPVYWVRCTLRPTNPCVINRRQLQMEVGYLKAFAAIIRKIHASACAHTVYESSSSSSSHTIYSSYSSYSYTSIYTAYIDTYMYTRLGIIKYNCCYN